MKLKNTTPLHHWEFGGEYSNLLGPLGRASLSTRLSENQALRADVAIGARYLEGLGVWGVGLAKDQVLRLGLQYLGQKETFAFESGDERAWVSQTTGSATWRLYHKGGSVEHIDLSGWYSVAPAKDLQDRDFIVDDALAFNVYRDPRRIVGRTQVGGEGKFRLRVTPADTLDIGAGLQRDRESTLTATPSTLRGIGSARWNHELSPTNKFSVGLRSAPSSLSGDMQWILATDAGNNLALQLSRSIGSSGVGNDTRFTLQYSLALERRLEGRRSTEVAVADDIPISQRVFDAVREKLDHLPSVVAARVDTTAKKQLLVQVSKAGLPAGAAVLPNGTIAFNFGASLGTFTSAVNTTTAAVLPASLFIINGNSLTIQVSQLEPYLAGSTAGAPHTLTLTTSTAVVTIQAYKGSVHIVSIAASGGLFENVDGTACPGTVPTPGCTFLRTTRARISVNSDPNYNRFGLGSDDLWYVKFYADGTADVYNDLGVYQYTSTTNMFAGWIGGNTIGVGTSGLYWENVTGGTYWLGRDGVLYNAMTGDSNYGKAIN